MSLSRALPRWRSCSSALPASPIPRTNLPDRLIAHLFRELQSRDPTRLRSASVLSLSRALRSRQRPRQALLLHRLARLQSRDAPLTTRVAWYTEVTAVYGAMRNSNKAVQNASRALAEIGPFQGIESVLGAAMHACTVASDGIGALRLLQEALSCRVAPAPKMYAQAIRLCAAGNRLDHAVRFFSQERREDGSVPHDVLASFIRRLSHEGKIGEAKSVFYAEPSPTLLLCNTFLLSLAHNRLTSEAFRFFSEMQTKHFATPDDVTFEALVQAAANAGQMDRVCGILEGLAMANARIPVQTLTLALQGCFRTNSIDYGFRIINLVRRFKYSIDLCVYHRLIRLCFAANRGLVEGGFAQRLSRAGTVMQWMKDDGQRPTVHTYELLLEMSLSMSAPRASSRSRRIFGRMVQDQVQPSERAFQLLLAAHSRSKDSRGARSAVASMLRSGLCLSSSTANTAIRACMSGGDRKSAAKVLDAMSTRQIPRDSQTFKTVLSGCARSWSASALLTVMAKFLLDENRLLDSDILRIIVTELGQRGQVAQAFQVFRSTAHLVAVDPALIDALVRAAVRSKALVKARAAFEWGEELGIPQTLSRCHAMIRGFICAQDTASAGRLLRVAGGRGVRPNLSTQTLLIRELCRVGSVETAYAVASAPVVRDAGTDLMTARLRECKNFGGVPFFVSLDDVTACIARRTFVYESTRAAEREFERARDGRVGSAAVSWIRLAHEALLDVETRLKERNLNIPAGMLGLVCDAARTMGVMDLSRDLRRKLAQRRHTKLLRELRLARPVLREV